MSDSNRNLIRGETGGQSDPRDDRRRSTRFKLRDARVMMSWNESSEDIACAGDVLNISGGGAAVLAERAPPVGQSVRLELEHRLTAFDPLEARSLEVSENPSGKLLVRLQFTHWVSLEAILEHHHDRRIWQRFPVRESRAKLTWLEDGLAKTALATLLNISGGGAAIIVDAIAPADTPIWFDLESDGRAPEPVESRLVVRSLDPSGVTITRIKFIDVCPILLFELAIHGSMGS
jgi:PilZ domain